MLVPEPRGITGMRYAAVRALATAAIGVAACRLEFIPWWAGLTAVGLGLALARPTRGWSLHAAFAAAVFLYACSFRAPAVNPDVYELRAFQGIVAEDPSELSARRVVVELQPPLSGRVIVWVSGPAHSLHSGDRVQVNGRIQPFSHPRNPGIPDYSKQYLSQGYVGEARVKSGAIRTIGASRGVLLAMRSFVCSVRRRSLTAISSLLPDDKAALLAGMVLGDRTAIPAGTRAAFADSGTAHVLAVSGLHVGIVAGMMWLLMGTLRIRGWLRFVLISLIVVSYVILTGARAPAVRAGVMSIAVLLSYPTQRKVEPLACLGVAGLFILLVDPHSLFSIGFQLSFAAAASIIVFVTQIRPLVGRIRNRTFQHVLIWPFVVSAAAFIGTGPLLLLHFHRVQPFSVLFSPVIVALTGIAIPLGFLTVLLAQVWTGAAGLAAETLRLVLWLMLRLTEFFGGQQWAIIQPGPVTLLFPVWVYGLVLLAVNRQRAWARTALRVGVLIGLNLIVWQAALRPAGTRATYLDPGQGDAVLLEDSLGRVVLIDAGISGKGVLRDYLRYRGIRRIDLAVITHPDNDHYGGLLDLERQCRIVRLLAPTTDGDSGYRHLLERLRTDGTELAIAGAGTELAGLGFGLSFVWPDPQTEAFYRKGLMPSNTVSLVAVCEHAGFRMLLSGDLDEPELLARIADRAELLKSPHHGSRKGNEPALYDIVRPDYVVVMGRFPTPAGLEERLSALGERYINTRRDGAWEIRFTSRGPVPHFLARSSVRLPVRVRARTGPP